MKRVHGFPFPSILAAITAAMVMTGATIAATILSHVGRRITAVIADIVAVITAALATVVVAADINLITTKERALEIRARSFCL